MLLVDSLYINYGGALVLLRYLVEGLRSKNVDFFLLYDSRCGNEFNDLPNSEQRKATFSQRRDFYNNHKYDFSSVLCFGNVPPPIKVSYRVFTYLHNINLLRIPVMPPWKKRLMDFFKQRVIDYFGKNTKAWIVQTENMKNELQAHLISGRKQILVLPFYRISEDLKKSKLVLDGRTDYAMIGELSYPRGHGIILDVWEELHRRGFDFTLHITVSNSTERQIAYCNRVRNLQLKGVRIINHGFVSFSEVIDIYKKTKAIVYPSLNESLGLSIIEAIEAGCDILASDRPFIHCICKPTKTFDPQSVNSICKTIIQYESDGGESSSLLIQNMIDELINSIVR